MTNNEELRSKVWLMTSILMLLVSFVHVTRLAPGERVNDLFEFAQMLTHKETQHLHETNANAQPGASNRLLVKPLPTSASEP